MTENRATVSTSRNGTITSAIRVGVVWVSENALAGHADVQGDHKDGCGS